MALTDTHPGGIIIAEGNWVQGAWQVIDEVPTRNADGWDELRVDYVVNQLNAGAITAEYAAASFPIGQQLAGRSLWAQGISGPRCWSGSLYRATVTYKGLLGTQPVVVDYDASGEVQSGQNVNVSGTLYASVSTRENTPTATARWISLDVDSLSTATVGRNATPPNAPDVASSIWDYLDVYTYHYPNGWVHNTRKVSRLPGSNKGLVVDSYQYIRDKTPGG